MGADDDDDNDEDDGFGDSRFAGKCMTYDWPILKKKGMLSMIDRVDFVSFIRIFFSVCLHPKISANFIHTFFIFSLSNES